MAKIQVDVELAPIDCASCGVWFAMPVRLISERQDDGEAFYCPNGHPLVYQNSVFDKLRSRAERAERDVLRLRAANDQFRAAETEVRKELDAAEREARRVGQLIHAGVCPHCHRTFVNLQRHMHSKHEAIKAAKA